MMMDGGAKVAAGVGLVPAAAAGGPGGIIVDGALVGSGLGEVALGGVLVGHGVFVGANTINHIIEGPMQMSDTSGVSSGGKAPSGDYRGVEYVDSGGVALGEFDRISGDVFIEEKSAHSIGKVNPKTGKPFPGSTPEEWAKKQIFDKTVTRLENLPKATATRPTKGGSPDVPDLSSIQHIRKYEFRIDSSTPELKKAVEAELENLRKKYPDWTFNAEFGTP
jgi:hypothetical protein